MARVNTVGLTELARKLQEQGVNSRQTAMRMLEYAGNEVAKATRISAEMYGLRDTGKMIESIKPGEVQVFSDSAEVEVWPQGSRRRGKSTERNALIGFLQHYGRSYGKTKRPGMAFFDDAVDLSAEAVTEGMAEIWREEEGNL